MENIRKPLAAIYARLSVDRDGKKVGIDTQLEDSRKLAKERDWIVVDEYIDRNLTAGDKLVHRPQYERLVRDFAAGKYASVICWDLDRLTRQPRQLEDWIDAAESKSVIVVTANGEADLGTDGGRLYARVKVAVAKGETERASARQKRSKQARRESGQWHGGPAPYGYHAEGGTLVAEPGEVQLIKEAARRLLDDREAMASIVKDWNSSTVPGGPEPKHRSRKGNHWRQPNLRSILMNRAMLGETKAGVKGWDAILDQRTFDRLQTLLTDPSRKVTHSPGVKGGKYAMTGGLTVCGHCGKPLVSSQKRRSKDYVQISIGCLNRVHGADPKHHVQKLREVTRNGEKVKVWQDTGRVAIDHRALEQYVWREVIARLEATPRWDQRMSEKDPRVNDRIDAFETERSALRDQRGRVKRAFVAGIIESEAEAKREMDRIDDELDGIEREIDRLVVRPVMDEAFKNIGGLAATWPTWAPGRRRAALRGFIDRVIINDRPKGVSPALPRTRGESDESLQERQREHMLDIVKQRVQIVWKWTA
ncbi:recombinase family protein [Cryobacterium mannosilyticum]|nr:recombinase family protein [Cryobacterium mannosilyticum]